MQPALIASWAVRIGVSQPAAVAGVCCTVAALVCLAVGLFVLVRVLRRLRGDEHVLDEALQALGYSLAEAQPDHSVERTMVAEGVIVRFRDGPRGHTWTAGLREYLPGQVHIEERLEEWPPRKVPDAFQIGDPDLDGRFRFVSERKALVLEALATSDVQEALLACAVVDVVVRGDEIVFADPERANLATRWGRPVRLDRLGTTRAIEAQLRVHCEVIALLEALARALRASRRF